MDRFLRLNGVLEISQLTAKKTHNARLYYHQFSLLPLFISLPGPDFMVELNVTSP